MAATVIVPTMSKGSTFIQVVAVIPTTVDSSSGATCNFPMPGAKLITGQAVSSDFNSKTLSVKASNDGTNFVAVATAIAVTSSGLFHINSTDYDDGTNVLTNDLGFLYYQLAFSGAPAATLTVTVIGTL
jgi:hypothetical protein